MKRWFALPGLIAVAGVVTIISYCTVPRNDCHTEHVDVLIVLGCPPDPDGRPSSEGRERVIEAVREFRSGRADHILLTGGSPHSLEAESIVLAPVAIRAGVPKQDLLLETQARNTMENIFYSERILQQHGWKTAEVISSPSHLARTALILNHDHLCWQTRASRWPVEYSRERIVRYYLREALETTALRWLGFRVVGYLASCLEPNTHSGTGFELPQDNGHKATQ